MDHVPAIAAYCGLYCGSCPHYTATRKGLLNEFARLVGMTPEEAACDGCRSARNPSWCGECELKACAKKHSLEFCGSCAEYPCRDWVEFRDDPSLPYHGEAGANLESIHDGGVDAWIGEQEKRWACTSCGKSFTWFQTACPACGRPTSGYERPKRS